MMDANGWTKIEGADRLAWWRLHDGEPLVLRPYGGGWLVWWSCYMDHARMTPRLALDAMAPGTPLPVGLSDDGKWKDPEAPASYAPKVGDWVRVVASGVAGHPLFVAEVHEDHVNAHGPHGPCRVHLKGTVWEPATRPDARWSSALDPVAGETVTARSGRVWQWTRAQGWVVGPLYVRREAIMARCWADGSLRSYGQRIATIPDTLRGLDRLDAASAVLDRRWDDVPDGVEVTLEWRGETEGIENPAPADEAGDRPVMVWWSCEDDHGFWLRDPTTGCDHYRAPGMPHPVAFAKALNWRAVEVPRG